MISKSRKRKGRDISRLGKTTSPPLPSSSDSGYVCLQNHSGDNAISHQRRAELIMEWQPLNSNSGGKNEDDEEILCGNVLPYIHWDCCGGSWVGHDLGAKTYVPLYGNEIPEVFQKCHQKIEDAIRLPRPLIYLIIAYFLAFDHLSGLCPSGLVLYRCSTYFIPSVLNWNCVGTEAFGLCCFVIEERGLGMPLSLRT